MIIYCCSVIEKHYLCKLANNPIPLRLELCPPPIWCTRLLTKIPSLVTRSLPPTQNYQDTERLWSYAGSLDSLTSDLQTLGAWSLGTSAVPLKYKSLSRALILVLIPKEPGIWTWPGLIWTLPLAVYIALRMSLIHGNSLLGSMWINCNVGKVNIVPDYCFYRYLGPHNWMGSFWLKWSPLQAFSHLVLPVSILWRGGDN